jgi:hypothetical protein
MSAMNKVHASFLEVERMRAEPLLGAKSILESTGMPTAEPVPNITMAPGATLSDDTETSVIGGPPEAVKPSTATCIVTVSVEVQAKKVPNASGANHRGY